MPNYDCKVADEVPILDVAAVRNDARTVTFFMVNRHPDEAMTIDLAMAGFAPTAIAEHITIDHPDLQAVNTAKAPDRVAPKRGKGLGLRDGAIKGKLPPRSYHVLRVSV